MHEEDIEKLQAELEELKLDAYRYKFIRSTVVSEEGVVGYDKSVDEHIKKRNENLN
jgi:hypothetical protein